MTTSEKVAYLKGLAEGMGIQEDGGQGKLFHVIIDILEDLSLDLADTKDALVDLTDGVEEILQRFYVHRIPHVLPHAIEFAKKLAGCCTMMREMLGELENFKKPEKLLKLSVDLNQAEEECDRFYLEAARAVPTQCTDLLEIIAWREIYDYMEDCADACEHVADTVATVVMKNT